MLQIGLYYELKVLKTVDFGLYLDTGEDGPYREILLPLRYVPKGASAGDVLRVFIYKDSQGRPIATTQKPKVLLNGFAGLEVKDINKYGAFLDWGVDNQLLLPYSEQPENIQTGKKCAIRLYLDEKTERLVATTKFEKHLKNTITAEDGLKEGYQVDLLIYGTTDLGYKAVVDQKFSGILYKNDVFQRLSLGDQVTGFIKRIREDGKIDLTLRKTGLDELEVSKEKILNKLKTNGGLLKLTDDSSPKWIQTMLEMSKKSFKKAAGMLYKEGLIEILPDGIRLKDKG